MGQETPNLLTPSLLIPSLLERSPGCGMMNKLTGKMVIKPLPGLVVIWLKALDGLGIPVKPLALEIEVFDLCHQLFVGVFFQPKRSAGVVLCQAACNDPT